jgi:hypothetical protein
MDDRERHQGGDWRRHPEQERERSGGRPGEEPQFGRPGQAGYGFGYGEGSPDGSRGQDQRSERQDHGQGGSGQGGGGQRGPAGAQAFAQGQGGGGYPGSQYSGGPQGGGRYGEEGRYAGQGQGGYSQGEGRGGYPGSQYSGGPQAGARGGGQSGADIGFGQGGAFQQGWGGQSDHQRRDMDHGDHPNHPGAGGGTYGQGQYGAGARRSEFRDEQRYNAGLHQDQDAPRGFAGHGASRGDLAGQDHDHEPDYVHYKRSRLEALDREHHEKRTAHERELDEHYGQFREHKRTRFGREFEDWRSQQQGQRTEGATGMTQGSNGGGTVGNLGSGSAKDGDEERDKSLSSPGSTGATDMSGVGGQGAAIGGGAGMKGAGAVGGSSDTMAAKTAGPGAPNPSTGADTSGVTTGSENKTH